ncbi:MAG: helix-turn-helix domain-containing protein, partial [Thermodesulfobacteriota bacterium]
VGEDQGPPVSPQPAPAAAPATLPSLQEYRAALERKYFQDLLDQTGGDVKAACRIAGLSRSRFYDLMKKYDLTPSG